ncbi:MAG: PEP-CTERM sorting domain-containing protein [Planctomycetota bacterium]
MNKATHCIASTLALAVTSTGHAAIFAGFDDQTDIGTTYGTANDTGQQTAVDQYGGIAGDGWTGGWNTWTGSGDPNYTREKTVLNADPLVGGSGNYLRIASTSTSTSPRWAVYRDLTSTSSIDLTQPGTVSFLYRLDDASLFQTGGSSFIQILGGARWGFNRDEATWAIASVGGASRTWGVNDGNGLGGGTVTDTGLEIIEGDTFSFVIDADPIASTYEISITNLDTGDSFTSTSPLGFAESQAGNNAQGDPLGNTFGESIWFVQQAFRAGTEAEPIANTFAASIDSISITPIPEPASVVLIGMGAFTLLSRRRRRFTFDG